jgi:hypothetical protein
MRVNDHSMGMNLGRRGISPMGVRLGICPGDMLSDQERAGHIAELQFSPGEPEMIIGAGLAAVGPVEGLALDVAHALQPGPDHRDLVRMVDAEPLRRMERDRL